MNRTNERTKPLFYPDGSLTCVSDRPKALLAELNRRGFTQIPSIQPTEYARLQCGRQQAVIVDARVAAVDMATIGVVVVEPRESGAA